MKITKIRRTMTFGNYENISVECEVDGYEDPKIAAEELEAEVNEIVFNIQEERELKISEQMEKRELDRSKQIESSIDFIDEDIPF